MQKKNIISKSTKKVLEVASRMWFVKKLLLIFFQNLQESTYARASLLICRTQTQQVFSSEAATRGVLFKKVFLEISQNSQEITCARASFLIKLQVQVALVLSCEFYERFGAHYLKSQYFWKTKFFVETWNFGRKIRFIDIILEKLGFSIWKTWFINLKIDL